LKSSRPTKILQVTSPRGTKWVQKNESEKINQNENNLKFIKLISVMADFQKPLILFEKIRGHSWPSEKNESK
jgi:hypothetical protein